MKKLLNLTLFIFFFIISYNIAYSQSQTDSVVVNDLSLQCDSSSGFNVDSLKANRYLLLKEWTFLSLTLKDTLELKAQIDSCDVYKLFVKKEKQIDKYKPMLSLYHFPNNSKIIEVKDLKKSGVKDRAIVYWIQYPKVYMYIEEDYDCYSSMMGHGNYQGRIKFSLLNTKKHKIINTINVTYEEFTYVLETGITYMEKEECIALPFSSPCRKSEMALSSRVVYKTKGNDNLHEGLTEILYLDDFNGDGSKLEFALYMASGGCMGTESSLFGYSKKKDKLLQYPIVIKEITKDSTNKVTIENKTINWLGYTFTMKFKDKKLKYEIDYRGRGGSLSKFELQFDAIKECFTGIEDDRETEYSEGEKASWISTPNVE